MELKDRQRIRHRILNWLLLAGRWIAVVLSRFAVTLFWLVGTTIRWLAITFDWLDIVFEKTLDWFFGTMWRWTKGLFISYLFSLPLSYVVPDLLMTILFIVMMPTVLVISFAPKLHYRSASLLEDGSKNQDVRAKHIMILALAVLGFILNDVYRGIQGLEYSSPEVIAVVLIVMLIWIYGSWIFATLWIYNRLRQHWHKARAWVATAVFVSDGIVILLFLTLSYVFVSNLAGM